MRSIAVIGGNNCTAEEAEWAEMVGRLIAEAGFALICGGRGGVMQAACKGASEAGGQAIGILPGNDAGSANHYVTIPIVTGIGIARNIIIIRSAGAVIAIGGRFGTLSEIAHARQLDKPVFSLSSWPNIPGVTPVNSPREAVEMAIDKYIE